MLGPRKGEGRTDILVNWEVPWQGRQLCIREAWLASMIPLLVNRNIVLEGSHNKNSDEPTHTENNMSYTTRLRSCMWKNSCPCFLSEENGLEADRELCTRATKTGPVCAL